MKLKRTSIIVQTWFSAVLNGICTIDEVPTVFGIRATVQAMIDELSDEE